MGARLVSSSRGLRILGSMRTLLSPSDSILVSLPLCFLDSNTLLSTYLFCNSRIHVITIYSGNICVVLYVNASVLAPRMDAGYGRDGTIKSQKRSSTVEK
jgi:hypothetical protein